MTDTELLSLATVFRVWPRDPRHCLSYVITVEQRHYENGGRWAICQGSSVWDSKAGWFVYEPMPSSRTDAHLARTRFPLDRAMAMAQLIAKPWQAELERWLKEGGLFRSPQPDEK